MANNVNICTVDVKAFFSHLVVMQTVMIHCFLISTAVNQGLEHLENRKICSRRGWFELVDVNHSARLGGMVGRSSCFSFTCRYIVCSH